MSTLRVIAGSAKGRRLKLVPGESTRPSMDRVKEALFGIIGIDILDARFLDLFAGTGSVAIEALSRGAAHAVLLDLDRDAIATIRDNLAITGLSERAEVRRTDAFAFLAGRVQPFEFVYVAPPQYKALWQRTVLAIDAQPGWLAPGGQLIVQIDPEEDAPLELQHFTRTDARKYGRTLLVFYQLTQAQEDA